MRTPYHVGLEPTFDLRAWQTLRPLVITLPSVGTLHIPAGFQTDGGSKPRILWPILGHPLSLDRYPGYIVHDYLYQAQPVSRRAADEALVEVWRRIGVAPWRCAIEYAGVRVGGWIGWRANQ